MCALCPTVDPGKPCHGCGIEAGTPRPRVAMKISTRPQDWAEPARAYLFPETRRRERA